MSVSVHHSPHILEIVKMLGIDPKRCRGLTFHMNVGDIVRVTADISAEEPELRKLAELVRAADGAVGIDVTPICSPYMVRPTKDGE